MNSKATDVVPGYNPSHGNIATVQLASGVGKQISAIQDVHANTAFTTTGANGGCAAAISPDGVTYTNLGTTQKANNGESQLMFVFVPAGWFLKLTVTNATLGLTTYY